MASAVDEIIALFREYAALTTLAEQTPQSFRVRAYENAIHGLEGHGDEIRDMTETELAKISGIGKSTAKKIREYFDTGKIEKLEKLRVEFPPEYVQLSRIPGVGPKSLAKLRASLHIENLDDLEAALQNQAIRELPGFGAKTEEKISRAIERLDLTSHDRRTPIATAMPIARRLVEKLEALPQVQRAQYCGSLRRFRETIGDIDILVASTDPLPIMDAFAALPEVSEVLAKGETKSSVLTSGGIQVDLRVVKPEQFGAAIMYFTGSKSHNIKLRQRAIERGWLLNEYGLSVTDTGEVLASETEQAIYAKLDLPFIEPPWREDTGEVEASAENAMPTAVRVADLRGDLHVHTSLSGDGRSPLEDVLARAAARNYRYLAITDHAENLAINGVSADELRDQRERLHELAEDYPKMRLLHGCELNIGAKGDLDYDPEFRMTFDWCVAAVHSAFDLPQAEQTKRITTAMQDPAVNVIGHLSGRMIGRRPGIELDIEAVLQAAVEYNTAIEINSALPRLDAATEVLRRAHDLGVVFVISTDAHHVDELDSRPQWGALQAQRGWVDKAHVANTWTLKKFRSWARKQRG